MRIGVPPPVTVQEVERTRKQLISFLNDKMPEARQVVIDLECFIRAVIADEVGKRW